MLCHFENLLVTFFLQTIRILLDDPACELFVFATLFWQSDDDESSRPAVPEIMWLISCKILVFDAKEESSDILATEDICFICVPFVLFNDTEESSKQFKTEKSFETTDEAEEIKEEMMMKMMSNDLES